jgi:YHS domain-containing protein
LITVLLLAGLLLVGLVVVDGCKKSEPKPAAPEASAAPAAPTMSQAAKETASQKIQTIEQTTCPVMGNPINKDIFVEYKGKKVYFCCPECKAKFEKEPEKYIAKLPQFNQ